MSRQPASPEWQGAIATFHQMAQQRLRLLLKRRTLWLRSQWQHDPAEESNKGIISDAHVAWLLRGEDSAAEQAFYQNDPAARTLTAAATNMQQQMANFRRQQLARAALPLDVLAHLFGLGDFECDVLLLCLAPELDAAIQPLFGYVQDNVNRVYPTMHLAYALFGTLDTPPYALHRAFGVDAPLRRYQLIALASDFLPTSLLALRLPERIMDYLLGVNRLDSALKERVTPMQEAELPLLEALPETLQQSVQQVLKGIEAGRANRNFPVVNLTGALDGGQREIASHVAQAMRIHLFELETTQLMDSSLDMADFVALLEREALLLQCAYFLDLSALDEVPPALRRFIHSVANQASLLLFIAQGERMGEGLEGSPRLINVQLPRLTSQDRLHLWQQALGSDAAHIDAGAIVQQFHFGPRAVRHSIQAARFATVMQGADGDQRAATNTATHAATNTALRMEEVWEACRRQSQWQLDDLAQRIEPAYCWEDLVLPLDVEAQLHEIEAQVKHRHRVYSTWGYEQRLNRGRGISALFAGASGTGKTMAAEVLANELKLPLYRIDLAGVVSKYVGETEKNLRRIFQAAEQSGTVLFFDEADALFGKRTDVKDSHDRYANIEVNYLLQLMESYSGLAILATNRRQAIDRAFLRRLRFVVDFVFPTVDNRRRIWRRAFPTNVPLGRIDYNQLAQLEIAGGNIHSIALNATFLAAADGEVVQMEHIVAAARREYAKIDKMETAGTFGEH